MITRLAAGARALVIFITISARFRFATDFRDDHGLNRPTNRPIDCPSDGPDTLCLAYGDVLIISSRASDCGVSVLRLHGCRVRVFIFNTSAARAREIKTVRREIKYRTILFVRSDGSHLK